MAAQVGVAPTPARLTGTRATLTLHGRRKARPVRAHTTNGAVDTKLHHSRGGASERFEKAGAPDGTCTHTLPADNGLLCDSATEAFERGTKNNSAFRVYMVGSAGNAPVRPLPVMFSDT